jgi:hypothetical protein
MTARHDPRAEINGHRYDLGAGVVCVMCGFRRKDDRTTPRSGVGCIRSGTIDGAVCCAVACGVAPAADNGSGMLCQLFPCRSDSAGEHTDPDEAGQEHPYRPQTEHVMRQRG